MDGLDFGKGFSRRAKFFEEYINPRVAYGIEDFLTMGLLPDIKGLYRNDLMKLAGRDIPTKTAPMVQYISIKHLQCLFNFNATFQQLLGLL